MRGALIRYRVMAFVVGTALLVVFAAIPFQRVEHVVGPIHGFLYIVYLIAAADLARRAHWRLGRILVVAAAGFVPFLAFVVEHRVNQQMQAELAAEAASGAPAVVATDGGPDRDGAGG